MTGKHVTCQRLASHEPWWKSPRNPFMWTTSSTGRSDGFLPDWCHPRWPGDVRRHRAIGRVTCAAWVRRGPKVAAGPIMLALLADRPGPGPTSVAVRPSLTARAKRGRGCELPPLPRSCSSVALRPRASNWISAQAIVPRGSQPDDRRTRFDTARRPDPSGLEHRRPAPVPSRVSKGPLK
jgi:hypothetical protein